MERASRPFGFVPVFVGLAAEIWYMLLAPAHKEEVRLKSKFVRVTAIIWLLGVGTGSADNAKWEPAYDESQLEFINKSLDTWKPSEKHTTVRDIFPQKQYQPPSDKLTLWPSEASPDSFPSQQQAIREGCRCDFIKNLEHKTCLLKTTGCQGAWLFVYDRDNSGKYVRNQIISVPTWYDLADVDFVDVFGDGQKFLRIEYVGDHGTACYEKIHWILGWHEGAFHTVFWEPVYYQLGETHYRTEYDIQKGMRPRIVLKHHYDTVLTGAEPYDNHSEWTEWLFWNATAFSLYDAKIADTNIQNGKWTQGLDGLRMNIERGREEVLKLPPLPSTVTNWQAPVDIHAQW
ncbi:MAG TPA: hypothetical protein VMV72_15085 [Verrucomicrobiae bacterium]|nr:hypothetical protein [Verrucomicrobiae bacterium]